MVVIWVGKVGVTLPQGTCLGKKRDENGSGMHTDGDDSATTRW